MKIEDIKYIINYEFSKDEKVIFMTHKSLKNVIKKYKKQSSSLAETLIIILNEFEKYRIPFYIKIKEYSIMVNFTADEIIITCNNNYNIDDLSLYEINNIKYFNVLNLV